MASLRDTMRRWAVAALAHRRGEVRAIQDLRRLGEVARLAGVFAVTMLLPIAFLAFLALTSIRSEELSLDADLRSRAVATGTQIQGELESIFGRFETATLERLRRGESPTANLGELSPYLRAAFRFDASGALAAPFDLPTDDRMPDSTAGWRDALRVARAKERAGDAEGGLDAWTRARGAARHPSREGVAMLGQARALAALGRHAEAQDLLADLVGEHDAVREEHGFRLGDLARLELLRLRLDRGDVDVARTALVDWVDELLQAQWTIGREGEAAVVREALRMLSERANPDQDWLARARSRLNERYAQLVWAEGVADELELVFSRIAEEDEFRYLGARVDSPGVWAIVRSGDSLYAFSFSVRDLYRDLAGSVERTNALDTDLTARLLLSDEDAADTALASRGLGPWLPVVTLVVDPSDPAGLQASKTRRRTVRIAIVLTAVFVSVVGALWVARMVAWEVENARQRADFAANVSHELRSPITQIRLKGEALQLGLAEPGEDTDLHYAAIVREAERLSRLVDNVLDFAAIERGAKRYQLRPDDLATIVAISVEAARANLEDKGMDLEVDLAEDLPRLWLDREAIGQVMTNLLSNAGKYGAEGRWVGVRVAPVTDGVELSVADRGIGISREEIGKVFDDFFRSTDPQVRRRKGTGIGLAIVRYIVEAHGGTIRVDSAPGHGATFTVFLPLEPPERGGETT